MKFARLPCSVHVIHTIHSEPQILWSGRKGKKDFKAAKWLVKYHHMQLIVLHEKMRKEVNQLFEVSNAIVLNNGINFERFEKRKDKATVRDELGIPKDAFVVGHVGRFSQEKNHVFLVDVFLGITRRKKNAFLLMIGDGSEKQKIEAMLEQNMLCGKYRILSNRIDVPDLMGTMDVFVFPSLYEGLGIVLIEAQKVGVPCFVSDCVPYAAKVSEQIEFLPFNTGADAWADKICKYDISCTSGKDIPAEWDMKNVIQKLERIYEKVMQNQF